jgi:alanyl-tRNA synthetase
MISISSPVLITPASILPVTTVPRPCGADAVKAGKAAGKIVTDACGKLGGKGGGKPDAAMGGGTDVSKVAEALASVA